MSQLNHVSVSAPDLEASTRFYEEVFGLERVPTPNFGFPVQWLKAGDGHVHLYQRDEDVPTQQHFALTVARDDFEAVYDRADERACFDRTTFSSHLVELPGDVAQLYVRDPAGNLVEVDCTGASSLPERLRAELTRLEDVYDQSAENARARLPLGEQ